MKIESFTITFVSGDGSEVNEVITKTLPKKLKLNLTPKDETFSQRLATTKALDTARKARVSGFTSTAKPTRPLSSFVSTKK
ncbi:hypothetical protein MUU75_04495 [Pseudoxanthomonas mexicana]|uniref:hypothetical protein n=1 Tax=Pseudoxanthomonas mexicana TaxID=128785 RepID=UPI001FD65574|nr:hypothetical protein [Pseudoxanthomonas mexicana]UOV05959.1 hypothetical protein MUU75_04495 [Pseudoxanthomonas mexicana]